MGKSLVIPGADFSAVAIPYIAEVVVFAGKQATIYDGNGIELFTIPAYNVEKQHDLTTMLSDATLFDFTFSGQNDVFKSINIDVSNASTLKFTIGLRNLETEGNSLLEKVVFSGLNEGNISIESVLQKQDKLTSIDMSCLHGNIISANYAFYKCRSVKTINLRNVKTIQSLNAYTFNSCELLERIDFSSLESIGTDVPIYMDSGIFKNDYNITEIVCPSLSNTSVSLLIKHLSAGPNILSKRVNGSIIKVDISHNWTYQSGTPDTSTMTLWDSSVWDNPTPGTTYYVDASITRLYTYNG